VIAIIAIAAAVVGPSLWRPGPRGAAAATAAVAEVYAAAREAAVERGGDAEVRLRLPEGRWVTLARDGREGIWDTLETGDIDPVSQDFELIGDGWAVVRFDSRGRAVGDPVSVSAPSGAITLRPDTWAGVLHVSAR